MAQLTVCGIKGHSVEKHIIERADGDTQQGQETICDRCGLWVNITQVHNKLGKYHIRISLNISDDSAAYPRDARLFNLFFYKILRIYRRIHCRLHEHVIPFAHWADMLNHKPVKEYCNMCGKEIIAQLNDDGTEVRISYLKHGFYREVRLEKV